MNRGQRVNELRMKEELNFFDSLQWIVGQKFEFHLFFSGSNEGRKELIFHWASVV